MLITGCGAADAAIAITISGHGDERIWFSDLRLNVPLVSVINSWVFGRLEIFPEEDPFYGSDELNQRISPFSEI